MSGPGRGTGLVVAAHGRRGRLELADGTVLPYQVGNRGPRPCCGDTVSWEMPPGLGSTLVTAVATRRNQICRQPARGMAPEVIATNVTHLGVVLAPVPEPDLFVADRYLCAGLLCDCRVAIIYAKADLAAVPGAISAFGAIGVPVLAVSARDGRGLAELRAWLGSGTGILVGQSGVGKSSLVNALVPTAGAATGSVSDATDEGRHTTTAAVMYRVDGGRLVDSPGVRDFVPAIPDRRRIAAGFSEIDALAGGCRFADCSHLREPGCAVQEAVAAGRIDERRYESYRRLMLLTAQAAEAAGPGPISPGGRRA